MIKAGDEVAISDPDIITALSCFKFLCQYKMWLVYLSLKDVGISKSNQEKYPEIFTSDFMYAQYQDMTKKSTLIRISSEELIAYGNLCSWVKILILR